MPVDLSKPLAWKTATGDAAAMLEQLQPNILKGHVREHMRILFDFDYDPKDSNGSRCRSFVQQGLRARLAGYGA